MALNHQFVWLPYLSLCAPSYSQRSPRLRVNLALTLTSSCTNQCIVLSRQPWITPLGPANTQYLQMLMLLAAVPVVLPGFAAVQVAACMAEGAQPARPIRKSEKLWNDKDPRCRLAMS